MFFKVLSSGTRLPTGLKNQSILLKDNWDDWFKYNTMYVLFYYDEAGESHRIGEVKIGQFGMEKEQRRAAIEEDFDELDERFFSLGQDDSYYEALNGLGASIRDRILKALNDVAKDVDLFQRTLGEDVTGVSLLRSVSTAAVRGQFHRMSNGGARLTRYAFSYHAPGSGTSNSEGPVFTFKVLPESEPPTNVHILIGRNGVGKTHNLNRMTRALVDPSAEQSDVGAFIDDAAPQSIFDDATSDESSNTIFSGIVSVTFSAFDPFEPLPNRRNKAEGVRYSYVGLKHSTPQENGKPRPPKDPEDLGRDFAASVWLILNQKAKMLRWISVLSILDSDPIFNSTALSQVVQEFAAVDNLDETSTEMRKDVQKRARAIFGMLSSGHKIVLLTLTRLIEAVEEQTLVLLDEPEAHLHPPLLSALVRALSHLLTDRNGVAIIATHSPVVLQEVPRSSVWKIRRVGREVKIERPQLETFGENVGTLTGEIFGLEVTDSGFHRLLARAVNDGLDFEDILRRFDHQLGDEARAIVRGLIASREDDASN
jgi:energy-coupling factor transporter ATP-binding protein EcfA2